MDDDFSVGRYDEDGNFYNCYYDEDGKLVWLPEVIEYAERYGFGRAM